MEDKNAGFIDFFREVPDHRINRHKLYPVEEILLVTFCGVIAGCDSWDDLELFGKTKLDSLQRYLPFTYGIPSDDTLRRFFRALDPDVFESCFVSWVESFQLELASKIIAIDGKTSRRSFDGDSRPMHMVSAFASEIGIVLGQRKVEDKSNEITAIPQLLELLDLAGAVVTIDAMGCQSKIASKIIEQKADYVLGLKGNQARLHDDVKLFFKDKPKQAAFQTIEDVDKGHGRIEIRRCSVSEDIKWLQEQHSHWAGLTSVVEIESIRIIKDTSTTEKRYYISSLQADPEKILNAVRQHWGIENKLHWVLDVSFGDDQSRIRKGHAPQNMAIVKKVALNLLQIIKKSKPRISLKRMRKLAGWDNAFLDAVLMAKF